MSRLPLKTKSEFLLLEANLLQRELETVLAAVRHYQAADEPVTIEALEESVFNLEGIGLRLQHALYPTDRERLPVEDRLAQLSINDLDDEEVGPHGQNGGSHE